MPATITGTMLTPGVSLNGRLYTTELIGKAVTRARERIKAGRMPLTMLTHHDADDDSTRIVGHLTHVEQAPDGSARFKAALADTGHAHNIATLVRDGHLGGVSIRGAWLGELRKVDVDGKPADTADDLELDGLDFTKNPGVPDARVDPMRRGGSKETAPARHPVTESVPMAMISETVEVNPVDEATSTATAPNGTVVYADPGYQQDKKKRYQLDTKAKAKAAWSYINQKDNAALYTPQQLKRVRQRIVKALKKYGVQVAAKEHLLIEPVVRLSESVAEEMGYPSDSGSYSITLTNGPTTVTICTYCLNPAELQVIGRAAMDGACQALAALDPDMGGDIDVPGAPDADTDHDMESATPPDDDDDQDGDGDTDDDDRDDDGPDDQPTKKSKESTVADKSTAESSATKAPAAAGITLTQEQFTALLDRVGGKNDTKPAAAAEERTAATAQAATETDDERIARLVDARVTARLAEQATDTAAAPVVETEEQRIARLVEARLTAAIQDTVVRQGPPTRKGLVGRVDESGKLTAVGTAASGELNEHGLPTEWPNKPLDKFTAEERTRFLSPALMNHVIGHRI